MASSSSSRKEYVNSRRGDGRRGRGGGGGGRKWVLLNRWLVQARQWVEQDPTWGATKAKVARLMQPLVNCWSRVEKGATLCAKVLLVLLFAVLECGVRGFRSILLLGSAALCLVLWCCLLSLTALAGSLWILIAVAATAAVAFFLGLVPGFTVVGLFGSVIAWKYGSFWTTFSAVFVAGGLQLADHRRMASVVILLYSVYSAKFHGGWLGLTLCTVLACIANDVVVHLLTSLEERKLREPEASKSGSRPTRPSVSDVSGQEEVARVLGCSDHYEVLGFTRFDSCEESAVKREYRKKAMLVHPDKNKGNARAEEAFKRLQNAYEVLLDAVKRKCYDDGLRQEELLSSFRRNDYSSIHKARCASPECPCHSGRNDGEPEAVNARPILCKSCRQLHMWILTDRPRQHARWCQDCEEYHPAKDGDGWVEQSCQLFLFGMFQKVNPPQAYVCAGGIVYDATEWALCQGMKCPVNTHKPSFYVGTTTPQGRRNGSSSARMPPDGFPNMEEGMSEQDFYEWLEKAFNDMNAAQSNNKREEQERESHTKSSTSSSGSASGTGSSSSSSRKSKRRNNKR